MFHFLFYLPHADHYAVLRIFKYLTFRSGGAVLTALSSWDRRSSAG